MAAQLCGQARALLRALTKLGESTTTSIIVIDSQLDHDLNSGTRSNQRPLNLNAEDKRDENSGLDHDNVGSSTNRFEVKSARAVRPFSRDDWPITFLPV
jgi:hypothetical protein